MAIIVDPDNLTQGASTNVTDLAFTASGTGAANRTVLTSTANLPTLAAGEFFEIRDSSTLGNNGLYVEVGGSPTTSSVTCEKITGVNPTDLSAEATTVLGNSTTTANEKTVHIDTDAKEIYLFEQGNIGTVTDATNGVAQLALHSFFKEEWKDDGTLDMHPFPMIGIDFDAGKWEYGTDPSGNYSGWKLAEDNATYSIYTKRLIRNAGWNEYDSDGIIQKKYFNVTTLGSFAETTDQAYYAFGNDPTDTAAAVDFIYPNVVNEPVQFYTEIGDLTGDTPAYGTTSTITRSTGSFITDGFIIGGAVTINDSTTNDGTYTLTNVEALTLTVSGTPLATETWDSSRIAVDNSVAVSAFLREGFGGTYGKSYAQANLSSAGETSIVNKVIKFPLSNADDLDITNNDAAIGSSPYTLIDIKYFDQAFSKDVDGTTNRNFGIVIDVDTHSGVDGSVSAGSVLTTAEGGITVDYFNGGTLYIWSDTDEGNTFSITDCDATTITISGSFAATESNISFTAYPASKTAATKNEIYEKIQYQLRQAADIDDTDQTVTGNTADALAKFVGPDLILGESIPTNPNGGGSGVLIEGFDASDTNNLYFYDNLGTRYNYPYVAAGSINFNANLVNDSDPYYWMYYAYTKLTTTSSGTAAINGASGSTADLEDITNSELPALSVNDYIEVDGFTNEVNNGIYVVTVVNTSTTDYTVRKLDGATLVDEGTATITVKEHPFGSDGALVVNDNSGSPIEGVITQSSISFDYDYDNNTQGGRGSTDDMKIVIVGIGLELGQYVITSEQDLTRATGLSYSVTSALERNYST